MHGTIDLADNLNAEAARERAEREYRDLLGRAGLRLDRITPTASGFSLVEALRVGCGLNCSSTI